MSVILKAARLAAHAHRNQVRKYPGPDGLLAPYIVHPARVASRLMIHHQEVMGHLSPEDAECVIAAAWLHDVVEDTDLNQIYIDAMFPEVTAKLVDRMTRKKGQGGQDYYEKFLYRNGGCFVSRAMKIADVYENLLDALPAPSEFRRRFAAKSREFLMVISNGTGNPFTAAVPLDLWNLTVQLLEKVEKSVDAV